MARAGGGGIFAWLFFKDVSIISPVFIMRPPIQFHASFFVGIGFISHERAGVCLSSTAKMRSSQSLFRLSTPFSFALSRACGGQSNFLQPSSSLPRAKILILEVVELLLTCLLQALTSELTGISPQRAFPLT